MNGRDLIECAIEDFESFYTNGFKVKIRYENGTSLRVKGSGEKIRIVVPMDFANMILETDGDKFYALLLLGHELSHYINKHNNHTDISPRETRGLEMWADFFGAIISMSIFILGDKTEKKFSFVPFEEKEKGIEVIIDSFERIYSVFKNTDGNNKYEHSSERLLIVQSGITSFLVRFAISKYINSKNIVELQKIYKEHSQSWAYEFAVKTTRSTAMKDIERIKGKLTAEVLDELEERKNLINLIHIKLMDGNMEITKGIHPHLKWILGTDFIRPDIEASSRQYIRELINMDD